MVENRDMAAPGGGRAGVRQRTSVQPVQTSQRDTKAKQRHRLANIKHPHHAQRPTEADTIYWGSEKGKVSTSL